MTVAQKARQFETQKNDEKTQKITHFSNSFARFSPPRRVLLPSLVSLESLFETEILKFTEGLEKKESCWKTLGLHVPIKKLSHTTQAMLPDFEKGIAFRDFSMVFVIFSMTPHTSKRGFTKDSVAKCDHWHLFFIWESIFMGT